MVDTILARLMDWLLAIPFLLFAISLVSVIGPGLTVVIIVIGFLGWAAVGRIVRGQVLSIREKEYVEAARSLGAGPWRIMFIDILPNVIAPIIVYTTLLIPVSIVAEASPVLPRRRHPAADRRLGPDDRRGAERLPVGPGGTWSSRAWRC